MITLDQALDVVMQLEYEQKEMLLEILRKRQIEDRREEIAQNADDELIGLFFEWLIYEFKQKSNITKSWGHIIKIRHRSLTPH